MSAIQESIIRSVKALSDEELQPIIDALEAITKKKGEPVAASRIMANRNGGFSRGGVAMTEAQIDLAERMGTLPGGRGTVVRRGNTVIFGGRR